MRRFTLATLAVAYCISMLGPGNVLADFKTGMDAYRAGDFPRAIQEFKADKSKFSYFNLCIMYYRGQGVKADPQQGIEYGKKAAKLGHPKAAMFLGTLYDKGENVPKDPATAGKWYLRAAELGDVNGQFNVGLMYTNGEGLEKNREKAVKWLKKSAAQGHIMAGKTLKVMGEEVPKAAAVQIEKQKGKPKRMVPIEGAGEKPVNEQPVKEQPVKEQPAKEQPVEPSK